MADLVGQRRQRQVDPLALEARTLAVERDMHAELVEQDRRQQLWADEAARRGMERRGRLADLLAIAAGELLAYLSISLKRRGISSSVLVTSSPIFASRDPPQQAQVVGASMTTRSRSMSSGHGLLCVFAAAACAASSSSLAVVTSSSSSNSSCSISRAVRSERCPYFAFELLDPQLEMRDQRLVVRQLRPRTGSHRLGSQPRLTLGLQRRQGTHKVRWKIVRLRYHEAIESDQAADSNRKSGYPTRVGRWVS
ncbi:hypothetical protein ACVW04_000137 [Bradyrhizobium sp. LM2.3]